MATLTFLGSSVAVPSIGHDNTYLCVETQASTLLIDCAGSPLLKMQLAGIEPARLRHVIFTHRHPDHMYGFPILMLGLWLLGQSSPVRAPSQRDGVPTGWSTYPVQVVAEPETLRTSEQLLELFRPEEWPGLVRPQYRPIDLRQESVVLDLPELLVTACATDHLIPSIGLKLLNTKSGRSVVYSSDTAPSPNLVHLARGANMLIHEASGAFPGHSSAAQAAQVAESAGVGALYLIHYPAGDWAGLGPTDEMAGHGSAPAQRCRDSAPKGGIGALLTEARQVYSGPVELARDFGTLEF